MVNFIISASILISSSVVIASKFPIFIPIVIAANIPSFIASSRFRDNVWSYVGTQRGIVERLFTYIRTTFSNPSTSKEIAIFKNGPLLLGKFKKTHNQYYRSFDKANKDNLFMMILVTLIQNGALIFTQGINLMSVLTGRIAVGQFALYFQQTINLSEGTTGILDGYSSMSVRSKYVDSYFELLNFPNSISTSKVAEIVPTNPKPATIEFKNVFFKYPETERFILKDFNLVINPGEKIALVGENGAGKSTLIKLLLRFYDTNDGEILINGINIKNLDLNQWHKQIGALFQDFIKYQFTFKENIIFGNLEKKDDMKALHDALKQSGAENYLADLPNGLEQIVGKTFDEGVDLSGGQWQKLALARAFFRDAPFLILDEPTSAIDAKAEFEIFENVQKLQKDKTVIIISHRFSTVRTADRILVLDEGKIIEEGSHEKLMKEKGVYAELFEIQAQGYK
jgi:ATP-binding cassette subfamily B protein